MTLADKLMTEADFLNWLINLAHLHGWHIAHFRPARTEKGWRTAVSGDGKGFPDCVLVRPPRVIFAELKIPPNQPSEEQWEWLYSLQSCFPPVDCFLWHPSDRDFIEQLLEGK